MARSFSQLQTYRFCPRQFEFGYVKKLPRGGISAGESFGTSMHNCLKKFGDLECNSVTVKQCNSDQLKLFMEDTPQVLPELSLETLINFWHQSFVVEGYDTRVEADKARKRGEQILRFYYDEWQQKEHEVVAIEKGFKMEAEGVVLSGRFDRVEQVEGGLKVIDYKTSKPRTQDQVDADLQLSVYAMVCPQVFAQPCVELCFLFLNQEGITEVTTYRTQAQLTDAARQIALLDERILAADFHPTPSREVCKRCPYKNVCDVAAT